MKRFRLICSGPAAGSHNMALDESIFNRYLEDGIPTLRLYRWQHPAFTYGISQDPERELDMKSCAIDGIEVVKRMTGGGIILHDDEITYSFVCSKEDVGEPQGVFVSYREICAFLIKFYKTLGLEASFALSSPGFKERSSPSEICSASYEKYDILINGKKIGGNAQKRKRHVIFQHGSIPCNIDWGFMRRYVKNLPEGIISNVTSLSEELKEVPDKNFLEKSLIEAFGSQFDVSFIKENELYHEAAMVK